MGINVIVIDDVFAEVEPLIQALQQDGKFTLRYSPWDSEPEADAVRAIVRREQYSVVLLDLFFRGEEKGEEIFRLLKRESVDAQIIILTSQGERGIFKKYKALGAYDFEIKANTPAQIQNCINKVEMAGEAGGSYAAEFDRIDKLYNTHPSQALHQFEALFNKGFNNLSRSKQYASRLKSYFGGMTVSHQQSRIPVTTLLGRMLNNCLRIEAADPTDVDNLMDLAVVHLHRGDEAKAEEVFRRLMHGSVPVPASVVNGIFVWLAELHFTLTSGPPSADWLLTRLVTAGDKQQYKYFIQGLGEYDRELWRPAVRKWLSTLEGLWSSGEKREAADLLTWLVTEYGASEIASLHSTGDSSEKERFLRFCEDAARLGANPDGQGAHGLLALLELIFKGKDLSLLSEDEKKSYYEILEQALLDCLTAEEHEEDVAARLYELMTKLQFSSAGLLMSVLGNIKNQRPDLWLKYLRSGMNHLSVIGRSAELHELADNNKRDLFHIMDPESLVITGHLLDASTSRLAVEFYREAVNKYLLAADSAKSVDDLFEPQRLIQLLEERGRSAEVQTLKEQLKQKKLRLRRTVLPLEGERFAILGGFPDKQDRYKELLEKNLGGTYGWYSGFSPGESANLIRSLKNRQHTAVIYITGQCKHETFTPVHEEVVKLNKSAAGIKEVILPIKCVQPDAVVNHVGEYFSGNDDNPDEAE